MKTDARLKADVTHELEYDPAINATHVGVAVKDGVVTLTGHLDTYAEKFAIERAVQRVEGVKAVAVELDVKLAPNHERSDSEIAEAIERSFEWHTLVPADRIRVKVEKGWVTLTGEVSWDYQRSSADNAVRTLTGVRGVSNQIGLTPAAVPGDVSERIKSALERHATEQAKGITVSVVGRTVTLRGKVDSWSERQAATKAAWAAPGVNLVVNDLIVARAA
jgi:osmotically-inducible protein OsmY